MRQNKRKTTEMENLHQRRHDSFHSEGEMQQILTETHSGETKQMRNCAVSTFKGKLTFLRFNIVKYKTRAFNRKIEIKRIPNLLNISLTAQFHGLCYETIASCF